MTKKTLQVFLFFFSSCEKNHMCFVFSFFCLAKKAQTTIAHTQVVKKRKGRVESCVFVRKRRKELHVQSSIFFFIGMAYSETGSDGNGDQPWDENRWQSRNRQTSRGALPVETVHRALFERVEASISFGFASVQRALTDLQLQLQIKLKQLREQQELILQTQAPGPDAFYELEENIKKIERSLAAFTAHADNLSHIKLTLARAAAFVSSEGNLSQLVVASAPRFRHTSPLCAMQEEAAFNGQEGRYERWLDPRNLPARQSDGRPMTSADANYNQMREDAEPHNDNRLISRAAAGPSVPGATCFVFYLPPTATNETLRTLFMPYGTVLNAYVAMDKITNRTRGFGFVDFARPSEAQAAIEALDKYPLEGKFLSVSLKV